MPPLHRLPRAAGRPRPALGRLLTARGVDGGRSVALSAALSWQGLWRSCRAGCLQEVGAHTTPNTRTAGGHAARTGARATRGSAGRRRQRRRAELSGPPVAPCAGALRACGALIPSGTDALRREGGLLFRAGRVPGFISGRLWGCGGDVAEAARVWTAHAPPIGLRRGAIGCKNRTPCAALARPEAGPRTTHALCSGSCGDPHVSHAGATAAPRHSLACGPGRIRNPTAHHRSAALAPRLPPSLPSSPPPPRSRRRWLRSRSAPPTLLLAPRHALRSSCKPCAAVASRRSGCCCPFGCPPSAPAPPPSLTAHSGRDCAPEQLSLTLAPRTAMVSMVAFAAGGVGLAVAPGRPPPLFSSAFVPARAVSVPTGGAARRLAPPPPRRPPQTRRRPASSPPPAPPRPPWRLWPWRRASR